MLIKFKKMKDTNIIKRKFCNNSSQLLKNATSRCWFIETDLIETIGTMYFNELIIRETLFYINSLVNHWVFLCVLQVVFHYQSITEPAIIKRLNCQLNKNTGEVIKNKPKYVHFLESPTEELDLNVQDQVVMVRSIHVMAVFVDAW